MCAAPLLGDRGAALGARDVTPSRGVPGVEALETPAGPCSARQPPYTHGSAPTVGYAPLSYH